MKTKRDQFLVSSSGDHIDNAIDRCKIRWINERRCESSSESSNGSASGSSNGSTNESSNVSSNESSYVSTNVSTNESSNGSTKLSRDDEYCIQYCTHQQYEKQLRHHHLPNSSLRLINLVQFLFLNLIHLFHLLNWKFVHQFTYQFSRHFSHQFSYHFVHHFVHHFSHHFVHHFSPHFNKLNHLTKSKLHKSDVISLLLLILISSSSLTSAQHSTCPNAKQINDLKPPNVNLNCDCTQTADGHKAAGWEIMCYSVESLHNNNNNNNNGK